MIDDDGMAATLGLRPFARVVEDERVEERQVAEQRVGEALRRQADPLARQPFQRPVLAEVDDGIGPPDVAEPAIEGVIMMRRRQVGLMVDGVRVHPVTARRLQARRTRCRTPGPPARSPIVDKCRRPGALPTGRSSRRRMRLGQFVEPAPIVPGRRPGRRPAASCASRQERFIVAAAIDQDWISSSPSAGGRRRGSRAAHGSRIFISDAGAFEADGVADLGRLAGGVREDERDALLRVRLPAQVAQRAASPATRSTRSATAHSGLPRWRTAMHRPIGVAERLLEARSAR